MTAPKTAKAPTKRAPRKPKVDLDYSALVAGDSESWVRTRNTAENVAKPWVADSWAARKPATVKRNNKDVQVELGKIKHVIVPEAGVDQVKNLLIRAGREGNVTIKFGKPEPQDNGSVKLTFRAETKQTRPRTAK